LANGVMTNTVTARQSWLRNYAVALTSLQLAANSHGGKVIGDPQTHLSVAQETETVSNVLHRLIAVGSQLETWPVPVLAKSYSIMLANKILSPEKKSRHTNETRLPQVVW
jgi:hypothetical protein